MVVAHHHPDNMGSHQPDEVDKPHPGYDDRAGQAAQDHVRQSQPLHMDAQAYGGFLAAEQGVVIPAMADAIQKQNQDHAGHDPQVTPAGAAQVSEGPEYQACKLDLVGKILDQCGCAAQHGADCHTGQHDPLRGDLLQPGQAQDHNRHGNGAKEGPQGNANAAGQIQGNDGKGRAKGGTLRYAQGGGGCQGIVKNGLQNTPRQPKPRACHNGGADPRHPVVPNDQIDLFIRGFPENSLDQLRYRCAIGPGTEGKQDGHQKQQRQEQQKQNAPGLIFAIVRQLVLTHQW